MAQKRGRGKPLKTRGSELLKNWRKPMSQMAAGSALGVDLSRLCAYETGRMRPGLEVAVRIEQITEGAVPAVSWMEPLKRRAA